MKERDGSVIGMTHILTVDFEEWFQSPFMERQIGPRLWDRLESRMERSLDRALELLSRCGASATFFVTSWAAQRFPELVSKVAEQGHEVAAWCRERTPVAARRETLAETREAIEAAVGVEPIGCRLPWGRERTASPQLLSALVEEGFHYVAEERPPRIGFRRAPGVLLLRQSGAESIWELPAASVSFLGAQLPMGDIAFVRRLPEALALGIAAGAALRRQAPQVVRLRLWELDDEQPRLAALGRLDRRRQYCNLGRTMSRLEHILLAGRFIGTAEYLSKEWQPLAAAIKSNRSRLARKRPALFESEGRIAHGPTRIGKGSGRREEDGNEGDRRPVELSVVIPCFNEEDSLDFLERSIGELRASADGGFRLHFVFVDDCSTDSTYESLAAVFGGRNDCTIVRHTVNMGIAAAIQTGYREARTELVASMDADCSYDPLELPRMARIAMREGADMVTASPYHPAGAVAGVAPWRLILSKSLSRLYHPLLRHKLSTYTSCFRVCRRSSVLKLPVEHCDYLGIVELLVRLDANGGKIVEFPTTLQSRLFGMSKMKTAKCIVGHLGLLAQVAWRAAASWRSRQSKGLEPQTEAKPRSSSVRARERQEVVR